MSEFFDLDVTRIQYANNSICEQLQFFFVRYFTGTITIRARYYRLKISLFEFKSKVFSFEILVFSYMGVFASLKIFQYVGFIIFSERFMSSI